MLQCAIFDSASTSFLPRIRWVLRGVHYKAPVLVFPTWDAASKHVQRQYQGGLVTLHDIFFSARRDRLVVFEIPGEHFHYYILIRSFTYQAATAATVSMEGKQLMNLRFFQSGIHSKGKNVVADFPR